MKIWPLGVGGWMPAYHRQTTSFLIEYKAHLILVDAGTGTVNLSGYETILSNYDTIDLILTHYHLDHVAGLFYLPKYLKRHKLTIWGPGKPYYEKSCSEVLSDFLMQPIVTTGVETLAESVECKSYTEVGFHIGDVKIGVLPQAHTQPSFGITIEEKLHIATDTKIDSAVFKLPVDLILHECWVKEEIYAGEHTSLEEILKVYDINGRIKGVGLIHRNPEYSDEHYASWIKKPVFIVMENQLIEI